MWDIITMNHNELKGTVAVLKQCWEDITGLTAQLDTLTISYIPETEVLKEVKSWTNNVATDLELKLRYLLEVKNDLISKTANPKAWVDIYLTNESMQGFIEVVLKSKNDIPLSGDVKFLMEQLISKEDLCQLSPITFRNLNDVSEWLHKSPQITVNDDVKCKDFESLICCLEEVKENLL